MINVTLPGMNISKNKIEEKIINLRCMDIWRLRESGIENMLLMGVNIEKLAAAHCVSPLTQRV